MIQLSIIKQTSNHQQVSKIIILENGQETVPVNGHYVMISQRVEDNTEYVEQVYSSSMIQLWVILGTPYSGSSSSVSGKKGTVVRGGLAGFRSFSSSGV